MKVISRERQERRTRAGASRYYAEVSKAAKSGMLSQSSLESSLNSIFVVNPTDAIEVYDGIQGVSLGVKLLHEVMVELRLLEHADLLRYSMALITLERSLAGRQGALQEVEQKISDIDEHWREVSPPSLDESVIAALEDLYQGTIGQLGPNIQILGKRHHLENTSNVNRIRALLLSGIRSAVLWRQLGERKWHFIFSYGSIV